MTRPLAAATSTALDQSVLPLAIIMYLDILGDPLYCWSGIGDLVFAAGATGDASLDGKTFYGTGTVIDISTVSDGIGGSDSLELSLPGVDMTQPALRQVITNRNAWQFRRAVVWLMALDPVTAAVVGNPFRIRTGRMDKMPYSEDDKGGVIKCSIEGQQAYGDVPLGSRYSEQRDINPNDVSQNYAYSLSNMTATMGTNTAGVGIAAGVAVGGYGATLNQRFTNTIATRIIV